MNTGPERRTSEVYERKFFTRIGIDMVAQDEHGGGKTGKAYRLTLSPFTKKREMRGEKTRQDIVTIMAWGGGGGVTVAAYNNKIPLSPTHGQNLQKSCLKATYRQIDSTAGFVKIPATA